jgi:hypothetical protein
MQYGAGNRSFLPAALWEPAAPAVDAKLATPTVDARPGAPVFGVGPLAPPVSLSGLPAVLCESGVPSPLIPHPVALTLRHEVGKDPAKLIPRPVALTLRAGQAHGRLLAGLLPWLARGGRIYCLDGGNVFDPCILAASAAQAGLDPNNVLERVFVSRAYTCHQFAEAVETMLAPLADERPVPLALVLAADRLFHDEDLPLHERRCLFDRGAAGVARLHRRGLPLLLTLTPARPNPWAGRLARVATITADVGRSLRAITEGTDNGSHTANLQPLP